MAKKITLLGVLLGLFVTIDAKRWTYKAPIYKPGNYSYEDTKQEINFLCDTVKKIQSLDELKDFLINNVIGISFSKDHTKLSYELRYNTRWFPANYNYFNGIVDKLNRIKETLVEKAQNSLKSSKAQSFSVSRKSSIIVDKNGSQQRKYSPQNFSDKVMQTQLYQLQDAANNMKSIQEIEKFLEDRDMGLTFNNDFTDLLYDPTSDTWFAANYTYFKGIVDLLEKFKETLLSKGQELFKASNNKPATK